MDASNLSERLQILTNNLLKLACKRRGKQSQATHQTKIETCLSWKFKGERNSFLRNFQIKAKIQIAAKLSLESKWIFDFSVCFFEPCRTQIPMFVPETSGMARWATHVTYFDIWMINTQRFHYFEKRGEAKSDLPSALSVQNFRIWKKVHITC